MDSLLGVVIGICLAASCGFRVFSPLLVVSMMARFGYLELSDGFAWMGGWPALVAFGIATVTEAVAYYVPWLDNLLDTIASPASVVAGTILFAAFVADFDPFLQWSLAIIAGGGAAGVVQGGTVATRLASTATTAGAANPLFNTLETLAGIVFSVLSIVVPILALILLIGVVGALYYFGRKIIRRLFKRNMKAEQA
jgi:hypothetical protein